MTTPAVEVLCAITCATKMKTMPERIRDVRTDLKLWRMITDLPRVAHKACSSNSSGYLIVRRKTKVPEAPGASVGTVSVSEVDPAVSPAIVPLLESLAD